MRNKRMSILQQLCSICGLMLVNLLLVQASEVIKLPHYSLKYSVATSADKSTIWRLWSDVSHWKKFDTLLEYSYLMGLSDNGFNE